MEHIAAIMLLVACPDDLSACTELSAPAAYFETVQDCEVALEPAMRKAAQDHPQLYGQCAELDPELMETDAEVVWDIGPEGNLYVSVESADVKLAANQ